MATPIAPASRVRFDQPDVEEEEEEKSPGESVPAEQLIMHNVKTALGLNEQQVNPPEPGFSAHVIKTLFGLPFYPLKVARVLIQLGYEPKPPEKRYSFVFQQYLFYYPGIIGYSRAIAQQSGWKAMYRGVGCHFIEDIVASTSGAIMTSFVENRLVGVYEKRKDTVLDVMLRTINMFITKLISDLTVTVIVHPFHVITVRNIAQQIGDEHIYKGLISSTREIYQTEGLRGFYSGLVPALWSAYVRLSIYMCLWCVTELVMLAMTGDKYNLPKLFFKGLVAFPVMAYVPQTYSYPLSMVSNVMAVNSSRLAAGNPPRMPIFNRWSDCAHYFRMSGNSFRGSGVIFPRFAYKDPPKAF